MSQLVIAEDRNEFEKVVNAVKNKVVYAVPILSGVKENPVINPISALILKVDNESGYYILPFQHNDALSIPREWVSTLNPARWITPYKKYLLHNFSQVHGEIVDFHGAAYLRNEEPDYRKFLPPEIVSMHTKFAHLKNVNRAVPIMSWLKYSEEVINHMIYSGIDGFDPTLNNVIIPATQFLEASGIHVDQRLFVERFGIRSERFVKNNLVYSHYNPYTAAGRVSNSWGGINFAALNKNDGTRKMFTSRFDKGMMILIDFESFHLRLAAHLMNYALSEEPVHETLAKEYFGKENITEQEYEQGKKITFKYLYSDERMENSTRTRFFEAVYKYTDEIWNMAARAGYVYSPGGRKIYLSRIDNPTPAKLFNYMLQLTETEVALAAILELKPLYESARSKIVLYTYDSILIDYSPEDGKELVLKSIATLNQHNKYPIKLYYGKNYHDMTRLQIKGVSL